MLMEAEVSSCFLLVEIAMRYSRSASYPAQVVFRKGHSQPEHHFGPVGYRGRPRWTEPLAALLSEEVGMWHCVSKYLHDVHVIIDEVPYSKLTADSTLLFPLLTEPEVFNIQAGARKTIYGIQPRPRPFLHT